MADKQIEKDVLATALDRLAAIAEAQQASAASQAVVSEATANRLKPKSLEIGEIPQISAFNPRGERQYPMPRLKCEIYAPWTIDPNSHGLTREEVELFNLLEPGAYTVSLTDGDSAKVEVIADVNEATGRIEKMKLKPTPSWSDEHRQRFPAMATMLRDMLGDSAKGVVSMKEEQRQIANGTLAVSVSA
jgi:hypothetical protein